MADFLTPIDLAEELKVSRQWITELLRQGRIKGTKISRNWFITRKDFEAYKKAEKPAKK